MCLLAEKQGGGVPSREEKSPARRGRSCLASEPVGSAQRDTKPAERRQVSGKEREHRTTLRGAIGSLSVSEYRESEPERFGLGRWGTEVPRDPLQGRRRRASRGAEGSYGRDSVLTNHIHETPAPCGTSPAFRVAGDSKVMRHRGQTCVVSQGRKLVVTEEPDAGNLHVRICGEGAG